MAIEDRVQNDSKNQDNLPVEANYILVGRFIFIGGALFRCFIEHYFDCQKKIIVSAAS